MNFRWFSVWICFFFLLAALPPTAQGYKDSFDVVIDGVPASGTTVLVSFQRSLGLQAAGDALRRGGFSVRSFHTFYGTRHSPDELSKRGGFKTGDLSFTLVEFKQRSLAQALEILRAMPEVADASPNFLRFPTFVPNDPYYQPYQGNFRQIGAEYAWDLSRGDGAVVAVIDSGYRKTGMDDMPIDLLTGYDFWGNDADVNDYIGHGTHVANTVAEATDNGRGAAGLAFEATIMPLKVFPDSEGGAYENDIIDAINYAVSNGADVINMSLGGPIYVSMTQTTCINAWAAGVVIFASSGNSGVSPVEYPAAYNSVIAVGSSAPHAPGQYPSRSSFSNYGNDLDILAPGEEIVQQTYDPYYGSIDYFGYSGTSMASPHAAAVGALMVAVNGPDPDGIAEILFETANRSSSGWDQSLGWGEINAYEAVREYGHDDDWHDDDSDDDFDATQDCDDVLTLIYIDCEMELKNGSNVLSAEAAYSLCLENAGPWACIKNCSTHEAVYTCGLLADCLMAKCDVPTTSDSPGGGDDDDAYDLCQICGS